MDIRRKNTIKIRAFHRKLALRLGILGILAAVLFGVITWFDQSNRIIDKVTNRVLHGTKLFNEQISYLIDIPSWPDKKAIQNELTAFTSRASRNIKEAEGHFVYVGIWDSQFGFLASVIDDDYPLMESLKSHKKQLELELKKAQKSLYKVHRANGIPHILMATPLVDAGGKPVAYVESIFAVSPQAIASARKEIRRTVLGVIGIVLVTTLLLYPTINLLTRQLSSLTINLLDANLETLKVLGSAIAKRDSDTDAHNYRVTIYAVRLAETIGMDPQAIQSLIKGAFLHDVGKIGIRDKILLKPGRLNDKEFEIMKTHVPHGLDIVNRSAWLKDAIDVVGYHHEKVDGSGYCEGLDSQGIPLAARVFAMADVFDALTSLRPYKEPFSFEKTMAILEEGRGKHFDANLLDAFTRIARPLYDEFAGRENDGLKTQLEEIIQRHFSRDAEISLQGPSLQSVV